MFVKVCVVNVLCILISVKLFRVMFVWFSVIGVVYDGFISMFFYMLIVENV